MTKAKRSLTLSNLYRVERGHHYENCYHINYIPKQYTSYLMNIINKIKKKIFFNSINFCLLRSNLRFNS